MNPNQSFIKDCVKDLKSLGLLKNNTIDKDYYRKWALKNHPDKSGNQELFKRVSGCKTLIESEIDKKSRPQSSSVPEPPTPKSPKMYEMLPTYSFIRHFKKNVDGSNVDLIQHNSTKKFYLIKQLKNLDEAKK